MNCKRRLLKFQFQLCDDGNGPKYRAMVLQTVMKFIVEYPKNLEQGVYFFMARTVNYVKIMPKTVFYIGTRSKLMELL